MNTASAEGLATATPTMSAEIEISVELGSKPVAEIDELRALGASLFTLGITGPDYDLAAAKEWLAWRDDSR